MTQPTSPLAIPLTRPAALHCRDRQTMPPKVDAIIDPAGGAVVKLVAESADRGCRLLAGDDSRLRARRAHAFTGQHPRHPHRL